MPPRLPVPCMACTLRVAGTWVLLRPSGRPGGPRPSERAGRRLGTGRRSATCWHSACVLAAEHGAGRAGRAACAAALCFRCSGRHHDAGLGALWPPGPVRRPAARGLPQDVGVSVQPWPGAAIGLAHAPLSPHWSCAARGGCCGADSACAPWRARRGGARTSAPPARGAAACRGMQPS